MYVMMIHGSVQIDYSVLEGRDAIGVYETEVFTIKTIEDSSLLFIEVPMNF